MGKRTLRQQTKSHQTQTFHFWQNRFLISHSRAFDRASLRHFVRFEYSISTASYGQFPLKYWHLNRSPETAPCGLTVLTVALIQTESESRRCRIVVPPAERCIAKQGGGLSKLYVIEVLYTLVCIVNKSRFSAMYKIINSVWGK